VTLTYIVPGTAAAPVDKAPSRSQVDEPSTVDLMHFVHLHQRIFDKDFNVVC